MENEDILLQVKELVRILYNGQMASIGEVSPATEQLYDLMENWQPRTLH